ncbi:MAG: hypothetical protein E7289_04800 [Lachnospiraceae bacterium]|nr:hypothetical protein [Lachnospiraceae bacterium]
MSVTGLILTICLYPFILIMYVLLKNDAEPKNGLYYGVKLQKEYRKDEAVEEISAVYKKQMKRCLWIMMLAPLPALFIPWDSIVVAVWMVWLTVSIFIFFVPFAVANRKLKDLKEEKGWMEAKITDIRIEMKDAGRIRRVKWYHFFPQCLISTAIFVWTMVGDWGNRAQPLLIMSAGFAGISFLFWWLSAWEDRKKTQIISSDSDVNVNYNRAKKNQSKNFWVACAWVNVLYMVGMLFSVNEWGQFTDVFWWVNGAYVAVTVFLVVWLVKKKTALDKTYEDRRDMEMAEDDDDNWIWGLIYYNPKDRHSMIEKRVGIGTSINMATPTGKGFAIFCGLSLLSMPIISIWVMMLEFTPIQLVATQGEVQGNHLRQEYVIPMLNIEDAELLTELPKMSRNSGTAMETLKKGSWSVKEEEGSCSVFLNPKNSLFLRIETPSKVYYLSGDSDAETRTVYDAIMMYQENE